MGMKIGIFSDSHEDIKAIDKAVEIFNKNNVTSVLHCGDLISPIMVKALSNLQSPLYYVKGNNDGETLFLHQKMQSINAKMFTIPTKINISEKHIFIMHEPIEIESLVKSNNYDLIAYGHTHKLVTKKINNTFLINPGECCGLLSGKKTIVILDFESGWEVITL